MSNYQKKVWKRGESGGTPILAEDLNKYEDYLFMHDQTIENLTHIPEGSTTADLEVIDGRLGYDGEIFNSLGDAIRGQIEDVYDRMGHPIYPKGTISFENLPSFDVVTVGDMYNISNKFTTDSRFAEGSGKKISAGANVYAIDVNGTMKWDLFAPVNNVVIDNALSDTSENPVQNKVVTGNVKDLKAHTRTNLLNPTAQTQTINGVTFTNNGDGTITVNGTASGGDAAVNLMSFNDFSILENTKLVGCSAGGTTQTYFLYISCYNGSTWVKEYRDYGKGVLVPNIPSEVNSVRLHIIIKNGTTVSNLIFKPMLTTDLSATYDDYVQYSGDGELNENVAEIYKVSDRVSDETYTNLINPSILLDTQTVNGVTCTNNGDGTFTLNGTASARTFFRLSVVNPIGVGVYEKGRRYKLTGCPSSGVPNKLALRYLQFQNGTQINYREDSKVGTIVTILQNTDNAYFSIVVDNGLTVNNVTFKPMLTTKLDATYDDYIPYSGSGALNENVQKMYNEQSAITTALNGKADSFSSLTTYYNANTDRTNVNNRKSAITYVYNTYILNGNRSTYDIRYTNGFYAAVTFCGSTVNPQCIETIYPGSADNTPYINMWQKISGVWTLYAPIQTKSDNGLTTTSKQIVGAINELDSELNTYSNMRSEVLVNATADWVQVGKVVTVFFGTITTDVIFSKLPIPYQRDNGALPVTMRQASDGAHLPGYFGIINGKAVLVCPTANLCYGTLTYITV